MAFPRGTTTTVWVVAVWALVEAWAGYVLLLRPRWRQDAAEAVHLERNGQGLKARDAAERIPRWLRSRFVTEARRQAAGYR